jgi:hypothetical protein
MPIDARAATVLALCALTAASCSGSSESDGKCHGPLSSSGEEAPNDATPCGAWLVTQLTREGLGGSFCVYSAETRALVGCAQVADSPSFCDGHSFEMISGSIPPELHFTAFVAPFGGFSYSCPGNADGGDGGRARTP